MRVAAIALAALVLLAYSNSFSAGFSLDSKGLILQDARVHAATSENLDLIAQHTYWWPIGESGLYRPLTTLSYLFNYAVLGNEDRPAGYHAFNLLLHIVNVLLVYGIARRIAGRTACWIAAVWAVHPLSTEAVTNIAGRADLLAAFGVLAAFFAYLNAADANGSRRLVWLAALAASTAVGVFSKEGAVAIAGVVALYEFVWWRRRRIAAFVPAAIAIALPIVVMWQQRTAVLNAAPAAEFPYVDNPIVGAGFPHGPLTAVAVMARYLWLLVWPARLSADYSYAQVPLAIGRAGDWIAWIAVALVSAILAVSFRRHRLTFFFGAFAFVTFLPASNLLFPTGTIMAERLMYLPSVGLVALIVIGLDAAAERTKTLAVMPIVFGILVVALGVRTWTRNPDWRDDVTLWTATVRTSPSSFKAHRAMAEALYDADASHSPSTPLGTGRLDAAIAEMEKSVALLQPLPDALNDARTHRQLASYYVERGDTIGRDALERHTALPPQSVEAYRRAVAMLQRTLAIVEASAKERPHATVSADAYRLLSAAHLRLGEIEPAVDAAERARALEPASVVGHRQLAAALLTANRYDEAATALMTGSLLTSSPELRQILIDVYRRGLDSDGCAVAATASGPVLNPSCAIVRRHLCAASVDASRLQLGVGLKEDAERLRASANDLGCPTSP
jgi:protein O-mannosyl-transferase